VGILEIIVRTLFLRHVRTSRRFLAPWAARAACCRGSTGGHAALALADDPSCFLAAVQMGITLVAILAGAFSGATVPTGSRDGSASSATAPYAMVDRAVRTIMTPRPDVAWPMSTIPGYQAYQPCRHWQADADHSCRALTTFSHCQHVRLGRQRALVSTTRSAGAVPKACRPA